MQHALPCSTIYLVTTAFPGELPGPTKTVDLENVNDELIPTEYAAKERDLEHAYVADIQDLPAGRGRTWSVNYV